MYSNTMLWLLAGIAFFLVYIARNKSPKADVAAAAALNVSTDPVLL